MNVPQLVWTQAAPVRAGWYWADALHLHEPAVVEVSRLPGDRLTIKEVSPDGGHIQFFPLDTFQRWAGPLEPPATPVTPGVTQDIPL